MGNWLTNKISNKIESLKWKFAPQKMQRKYIDAAVNLINKYPETQLLLQLANAEGVGIAFDPSMKGGEAAGMLKFDRKTGQQYIALEPGADPNSIAYSLIHELRHVWQNKVLGITPQTMNIGEPDSETAMILNRVREADAHAFTNLIIRRMNVAAVDEAEAQKLVQKLNKAGEAPDAFQIEMISKFMTEKFMSRLQADHNEMVADFVFALQNLDSYDRRQAIDYHLRYTSPQQQSEPHADVPFGLQDIRRLLIMGVTPNLPPYLAQVPDEVFKEAVLHDVAPALKQTVNLQQAFEKAAARGVTPQENIAFRSEVEQSLAQALQAPPVPHTPSRY